MNNIYPLRAEEGKEGEERRVEAVEERGVEPQEQPQVEAPRTLSGLLKQGLTLPTYSIPWETYTTAFETIKRMNQEGRERKR